MITDLRNIPDDTELRFVKAFKDILFYENDFIEVQCREYGVNFFPIETYGDLKTSDTFIVKLKRGSKNAN